MATAAMLKHRDDPAISIHAQRINEARWAVLSDTLRRNLVKDSQFRPWEANAIADAMIEVVRATGSIDADKLAKALHSKQFSLGSAKQIASAIARSYAL
jgi:hypothetical protein